MAISLAGRERSVKRRAAFDRLVEVLQPIIRVVDEAKGTRLLEQGQKPDGIFLVFSGTIELSVRGHGGKITSRLLKGCEVLGLCSVFCGTPAASSAEVRTKSSIGFVPEKDFFAFFHQHAEARLPVLQLLSEEVNSCYDVIRSSRRAA